MKMKKGLIRTLAILIMLGALWVVHSGCATSPPARFYTLSPSVQTVAGAKSLGEGECLSLGIGPIRIPYYLDQPKIVTREAPHEIRLAEFDLWADLLKDNLTRVLAKNLSALLCAKTIVIYPWRKEIPIDYRIEMQVLRLEGGLGGDVSLEAWWMILSGDGKKMLSNKTSIFTEAVGGKDYASLVSAKSRTVGLLSKEIAEAINMISKK
jgi:uncharacterized protein